MKELGRGQLFRGAAAVRRFPEDVPGATTLGESEDHFFAIRSPNPNTGPVVRHQRGQGVTLEVVNVGPVALLLDQVHYQLSSVGRELKKLVTTLPSA